MVDVTTAVLREIIPVIYFDDELELHLRIGGGGASLMLSKRYA